MKNVIYNVNKLEERGYSLGDEVMLPVTIRAFNAGGEKGTVWFETVVSRKSIFVSADDIVFAPSIKLIDGMEYIVDGEVSKVVYYNLRFYSIRRKDSAFNEITEDTKIEKYE